MSKKSQRELWSDSESETRVRDSFTNLWGVHDDGGDKIEEDVVTVGPDSSVVESHF